MGSFNQSLGLPSIHENQARGRVPKKNGPAHSADEACSSFYANPSEATVLPKSTLQMYFLFSNLGGIATCHIEMSA